ncbi:MAG: nucleoside triphosphate hydrolase [Alphaproteobacteria bacterium]|nr:MAG: nucleoside triphosphate hydrolase [Alphaproteobacteria bacterium]
MARRLAGLAGRPPEGTARRLVAVAGPPGAGKSTLAEALAQAFGEAGEAAEVMPMDGFHLDNGLLAARGLLARKGAPETFDFAGFASAIARLRDGGELIVPVFDRSREMAIAGARAIGPEVRTVVVEGNYLLLDEEPWRALAAAWDFSAFIELPEAELERRLIARWEGYGYAPEAARQKALGNDIPNARRVLQRRLPADVVIDQASGDVRPSPKHR